MKDIVTDMKSILIIKKILKKQMIFSGMSPDNKLPEIVELKDHPVLLEYSFILNLNLDL